MAQKGISYKKINVTKPIYEKLINSKKDFKKKVGINFSMSATINELYKIIDDFKKKENDR